MRVRGGILSGISQSNLRRADRVFKAIQRIRGDAWDESATLLRQSMLDLVGNEVDFTTGAIRTVSPVILEFAIPPAPVLKSLVTTRPFEGRLLKEWSQSMRRSDLRRIEDTIKTGVIQGFSSRTIARNVVGTRAIRGRNGATQATRHDVDAIVRTATNHFSNQARNEVFLLNQDIVQEEQYVATLDSRTTPVCRSLDGTRYPVGEGRFPPVHVNCRSLRVAVIDGELLGNRPANPATQSMLLREFTEQRGLSRVRSRADLPRGNKTAFDKFKRKRVRELIGNVPAKTTYQEWIKNQSREFQDDVLGKTKARLFRTGQVNLSKFVNRSGDELTLSQLAQSDAAAFRAAGLDPEVFR